MRLVSFRRLAAKNIKIARPTLFNYIYTREEFEHYTKELFQMMSRDKFNVRIHEIYPLEEVARAHNVGFGSFMLSLRYLANGIAGSGRTEDDREATYETIGFTLFYRMLVSSTTFDVPKRFELMPKQSRTPQIDL